MRKTKIQTHLLKIPVQQQHRQNALNSIATAIPLSHTTHTLFERKERRDAGKLLNTASVQRTLTRARSEQSARTARGASGGAARHRVPRPSMSPRSAPAHRDKQHN